MRWVVEEDEEDEAEEEEVELERDDDMDTDEAIWLGVTLGTTVQKVLFEGGGGRET